MFCQKKKEKNAAGLFFFFIPILLTYFDIFVSQNHLHDILLWELLINSYTLFI